MESIVCEINAEKFDRSVRSDDSLPEGGDLAVYVKRGATVDGSPAAVLTFSVQLPDGTRRRAQAVTTVKLLETMLDVVRAWRVSGRLDREDLN